MTAENDDENNDPVTAYLPFTPDTRVGGQQLHATVLR